MKNLPKIDLISLFKKSRLTVSLFAMIVFLSVILIGVRVANASEQSFVVTYFINQASGGTAPVGPMQYAHNETVTVLPNSGGLYKIGFVFGGWLNDGKIYNPGDTFKMGINDVALSAVWVPTFTITYNGNDNASGTAPFDASHYTAGSPVNVAENSGNLNKNYGFMCWNTKPDGSGISYQPGQTILMGNENIILYAKYHLSLPVVIIEDKEYYTLTYNGNGSNEGYAPVDSTHYSKIVNIYENTNATVLSNSGGLLKNGYIFCGWNTKHDGSGINYQPGDAFYLGGDLTLYAKWKPVYTLTYDSNGGESNFIQPMQYPSGEKVRVIDKYRISLIRYDYTFLGWNTNSFGTGTTYTPEDVFTITSDMTLYAIWRPTYDANNKPRYVFTYHGDGNTDGALPPMQLLPANQETIITLPGQGTLKKNGYIFDGWIRDYNIVYNEGDTVKLLNSAYDVYAKWIPAFTVTYDKNGANSGSAPLDSNVYITGVPVQIMANAGALYNSIKGYFFCWNTKADGSGTSYSPGDVVSLSADLTLYAIYSTIVIETPTPPPIINIGNIIYPVTYYGNGATGGQPPVDTTNYVSGNTVTVRAPDGLSKNGCSFIYWSTNFNGSGNKYYSGSTFTFPSNTTTIMLYAQWSQQYDIIVSERIVPGSAEVSYDGNGANGGSAPASYRLSGGDTITVAGNPGLLYKKGYSFGGWWSSADGCTYHAGETFSMPGDSENAQAVTLKAIWNPTPTYYRVTYVKDASVSGSVPIDSTQYELGDIYTIKINTLSRQGYFFIGWNTKADGTGINYLVEDTAKLITQGITLYAYFLPVQHYYVTYNGNGNTIGSPPVEARRFAGGYAPNSIVSVACNTGMIKDSLRNYFFGWNTKADGTGTTYREGTTLIMGTSDIILYAIWKGYPNTLTVTYIGSGSESGIVPINNNNYLPGDNVLIAQNSGDLKKENYFFDGWWANGKIYKPGDKIIIGTDHILFYSIWGEYNLERPSFSVSYEGNGNTGGVAPINQDAYQEYGYFLTLPENTGGFVKPGYVFNCWTDGINMYRPGDQYFTTTTLNHITFYAVWTPACYVVYNGNGNMGGAVPTDTNGYKEGSTAIAFGNTGNLTKTGYIFVGWWINGGLYMPGLSFPIGYVNKASAVWVQSDVMALSDNIKISTPLFYQNNAITETLSPGTAQCKFSITNNTNTTISPSITIAAFKGGRMVNIIIKDLTLYLGTSEDMIIDVTVPMSCEYIKFLVFESIYNIKPISTPSKIMVH